ncbi:hypothetical protein Enr10x_08340 [Gimesia panareensis]|uniref:Uncharacterized protein n=1 Tax=Gimesia panareensis TaxID=2527978 RepID=A0A517Q1N2_9PLAN|nr:hypothetical protein [Gimesia panareensis]QDT25537.1 hypothetical protein Enr10x_08340 [Gimesia panareensis]
MSLIQVFMLFGIICLLYQMREHLRRLRKLQNEIEELKHLITGAPQSETSKEN